MSAIRQIAMFEGDNLFVDAVFDTQQSRGSGDLVITTGSRIGAGYGGDLLVEQGPTVTGPWAPPPCPQPPQLLYGDVQSTTLPSVVIAPINWSARFLRVTIDNTSSSIIDVKLIQPGGNAIK